MDWVIAYDISDGRRRARVARRLERAGIRVQKSVFLVRMSRRELKRLVRELVRMVDKRTDSVTAWQLNRHWIARLQGASPDQPPQFKDFFVR